MTMFKPFFCEGFPQMQQPLRRPQEPVIGHHKTQESGHWWDCICVLIPSCITFPQPLTKFPTTKYILPYNNSVDKIRFQNKNLLNHLTTPWGHSTPCTSRLPLPLGWNNFITSLLLIQAFLVQDKSKHYVCVYVDLIPTLFCIYLPNAVILGLTST